MNDKEFIRLKEIVKQTFKGGEGSGNFGHAGRPGEVGGSASTGGEGKSSRGSEFKNRFTGSEQNELNKNGFDKNPRDKSEYRREVQRRDKPAYYGSSRKWETITVVDGKFYVTSPSGYTTVHDDIRSAVSYLDQIRK